MDFHQVCQQWRHSVALLIQATLVHLIYCTSSGVKENEIRGIFFLRPKLFHFSLKCYCLLNPSFSTAHPLCESCKCNS